jgi:hypothetical protein
MHGSFLIRGPPVAFLNWNFQIDWPLFKIRLFSWLIDWKWKYLSLNHKKKKKKLVLIRKIECWITLFVPALTMICIIYGKKKKKTDGEMVVTGDKTPFIMSLLKLYYILLSFIFCGISSISLSIMANMVVEKPAPPTYS